MRSMVGYLDMSTLNRRALYTWGTKHKSAIVIVSPTQYFPAVPNKTASNPAMQVLEGVDIELRVCAPSNPVLMAHWPHSTLRSMPCLRKTRRFCIERGGMYFCGAHTWKYLHGLNPTGNDLRNLPHTLPLDRICR